MQKHVNLVDLVKSFPTNIFLQNLASIQKRTSPIKFAHLAEESDNGSVSNLSTKPSAAAAFDPTQTPRTAFVPAGHAAQHPRMSVLQISPAGQNTHAPPCGDPSTGHESAQDAAPLFH